MMRGEKKPNVHLDEGANSGRPTLRGQAEIISAKRVNSSTAIRGRVGVDGSSGHVGEDTGGRRGLLVPDRPHWGDIVSARPVKGGKRRRRGEGIPWLVFPVVHWYVCGPTPISFPAFDVLQ